MSKYADHTPLHRQCQIFAREGVELRRSTLADWVGQAAQLLTPVAEAIGRYVRAAAKIHADDTPIRVLGGKANKAKTGRLWAYVRDDRASADTAAPASGRGAAWPSAGRTTCTWALTAVVTALR